MYLSVFDLFRVYKKLPILYLTDLFDTYQYQFV